MPPEDEKVRPSKEDIALLEKWIEAGAPEVQRTAEQRRFISDAEIIGYIANDLEALNERHRRFARYLTITHLYNAGLAEDQLQTYRLGLAKLVNSLSWEREIVVPRAVDPARTIFHVDLRNYRWTAHTWQRVLELYPYGVLYRTPQARAVYAATDFDLPYVRADWFVFAASRPPLYHDILGLPKTDHDLERELKIDVVANIRDEWVARAGFNSSGVSRNNRLIERHPSPFGAYWKSYDFAGNTGRQNLFAYPLGPSGIELDKSINATDTFQHDGGEIIFSLPNGLHAYLLVDAKGNRIDEGPTRIVSVKNKPNPVVLNGVSCMFCHARGMIDKSDQIRAHVEKNPFAPAVARTVQELYRPEAEFRSLLKKDAEQFARAVEATGVKLGTTEPVVALAERFEAEIDLPNAGAELGLASDIFVSELCRHADLATRLGALKVEGQTVQRDVFVNSFEEVVDALRLGIPLQRLTKEIAAASAAIKSNPKNPSPFFDRANAHFDKGDYERAVADYTEAIQRDIKGADVLLYRGMAFANLGKVDDAIREYSAAIRLEPQRAELYHNRGLMHGRGDDLRAAVADFTETIRLEPENAQAYSDRGLVQGRRGELEKALADFAASLRLRPGHAVTHFRRANVLRQQKDFEPALAAYGEAIRLGLDTREACQRRGETHAERGAYAAALADFRKALARDPRSAVVHNEIAWLLATAPDDKLRDGKQAVEHATRACAATAYADFELIDTLAAAHAECGDFDAAVQWAQKALDLAPAEKKSEIRGRLELYRAKQPYRLGPSADLSSRRRSVTLNGLPSFRLTPW
jgi:tetratricopeptide (TPR) repeat protein